MWFKKFMHAAVKSYFIYLKENTFIRSISLKSMLIFKVYVKCITG